MQSAQFDRHSVEADLYNLGCDRTSAFSLSAAIAEIALNADERGQDFVITYEATELFVVVEVLHYNAKPPDPAQFAKRPRLLDARGRGFAMARSLVHTIELDLTRPTTGFTVRLVEEKRRPRSGEIS